jgi:hypothetical protein
MNILAVKRDLGLKHWEFLFSGLFLLSFLNLPHICVSLIIKKPMRNAMLHVLAVKAFLGIIL